MRCWGRTFGAATAAIVGSILIPSPSQATPSHPGGVADTCPEVLSGRPTGGLEKLTAPRPESEVPRGAVITVTLRWDRAAFADAALHKALDCVTVDGEPAGALSRQERDPANDGEFILRLTVPDHLADGTRLCDRAFVSGDGPDGSFVREKSNDVCFTVRGDSAPGVAPPTGTALQPVPEPEAADGAPTVPTPVTVPEAGPAPASPALFPAPIVEVVAGPSDADVGPAGGGMPGTDVAGTTDVTDDAGPTLPRTGASVIPMTAGGLGAIAAGVLARRAGRGLRFRRRRNG